MMYLHTAQYNVAIARLHRFSNLLGVKGSNTGRLIAAVAKFISETVEKSLKCDITMINNLYLTYL